MTPRGMTTGAAAKAGTDEWSHRTGLGTNLTGNATGTVAGAVSP